MKKLAQKMVLIFIFSILHLNFVFAMDTNIQFFQGTWEEALAESQRQNKLIFLTAYATWSNPSKYMEENVFVKEEVATFYNQNFIPYKINISQSEGEKLFYGYNGSELPAFFFINSQERLVYKKEGSFSPKGLIQVGKNALVVYKLKKRYAQGDRSPKFVKEYISVLAGTPDLSAAKLAQVYFKSLKDEELLTAENFQFMIDYPRIFKSREFQYFLKNPEKFHKAFGKNSLILVDRVFNELFEKSIKNREKKYLDEIVNVFAKIKKIMPEKLDLEALRKQLYERYDDIIYKKDQKK